LQEEDTLNMQQSRPEDHLKDFKQMVESYRSPLIRYCMLLTKSLWEAEDLVQETFLKVYSRVDESSHKEVTKSFLFRIAYHSWIDRLRKERKYGSSIALDHLEIQDHSLHPFDIKMALERLVASLPATQSVILLLNNYFQYTASEISRETGMTEGAVKAILHRAHAKLKVIGANEVSDKGLTSEQMKLLEVFQYAINMGDAGRLIQAFREIKSTYSKSHPSRLRRNATIELRCLAA